MNELDVYMYYATLRVLMHYTTAYLLVFAMLVSLLLTWVMFHFFANDRRRLYMRYCIPSSFNWFTRASNLVSSVTSEPISIKIGRIGLVY